MELLVQRCPSGQNDKAVADIGPTLGDFCLLGKCLATRTDRFSATFKSTLPMLGYHRQWVVKKNAPLLTLDPK